MDDLDGRLIRCFSSVYPDLTEDQIRTAGPEFLAAWDSLTAVTLIAVVEEEFGLQINLMDLPEQVTFDAVRKFIHAHTTAS
jgi:acyl carrier protein